MVLTRFGRKRGFTLPEMLISIGLFGLVWVSLVGSILAGKAVEIRARHKIQATYAAQRVIENLRGLPYLSVISAPDTAIEIDRQGPLFGTSAVTVSFINAYCKKINVRITWRELTPLGQSVAVSESLSTYISAFSAASSFTP